MPSRKNVTFDTNKVERLIASGVVTLSQIQVLGQAEYDSLQLILQVMEENIAWFTPPLDPHVC